MKIIKVIITSFLALIFTFTLLHFLDIQREKKAFKIIEKAIDIDFVDRNTKDGVSIEDFYKIAEELDASLILINRDPENSIETYNLYNFPKKDYKTIKQIEKRYIKKNNYQVKDLNRNYSIVSGGFRGIYKKGLTELEVTKAIETLNLSNKYKVSDKWHGQSMVEKYFIIVLEYNKSFTMLLSIVIFLLANSIVTFIKKEKKVALTLLYGLNNISKFKVLLVGEYLYFLKIFGLTGILGILIFYRKIDFDYFVALFNYFGILIIIFSFLTLVVLIFLKKMKISKSVKGSNNYKLFLFIFKFSMLFFSIIIAFSINNVKTTFNTEKQYDNYIEGWNEYKDFYKPFGDTGAVTPKNGYEFMKEFEDVEKGFSARFSEHNSLSLTKEGDIDSYASLGSNVSPNYFEYVDIYDEFDNKITSKTFEKNTDYVLIPIEFKETLKNSKEKIIFYKEQEFFTFSPSGRKVPLKVKNPILYVWNNYNFPGESFLFLKAKSKDEAIKKMNNALKNIGVKNAVINIGHAYMQEEDVLKELPTQRVEEFSYTLINFIILVLLINSIVIIDLKINNKKYMIKFIYGMKVKKIMKNLIQDVIFINSILLLMNMFLLGRTLELIFLIFIQMFLEILYILIYSKINLNKNMYNVLKGE